MASPLPTLLLPLLAGIVMACPARQRVAVSDDDAFDSERSSPLPGSGARPRDVDVSCAGEVRELVTRYCEDAPASLFEGYAQAARERWAALEPECRGPRSREALRRFDECLAELEADPSQIDHALRERRRAAGAQVAALKADPLFSHGARKLRSAIREADDAADEFRAAVAAGDSDASRFHLETWTQLEKEAADAERALIELIVRHGIDPRDAQALGLR